MQQLQRKLTLAAILLALAPCASPTNTGLDNKVNSFYSKKQVLEEKSEGTKKTIKTYYVLSNKIEVEVVQQNSQIEVKILKDPDNLIIKNTPKIDSAEGTVYGMDENGNRRISFKFNNCWVYASFVSKGNKAVIHYHSGGFEGDLPDVFVEKAESKLKEIENDLHISDLLIY